MKRLGSAFEHIGTMTGPGPTSWPCATAYLPASFSSCNG